MELHSQPAWQAAGLRYNRYGWALRQRFGGRVQRVSLDAGFTCPNVDGTVARGGCTFCDNRSFSPSRRMKIRDVLAQLERGTAALRKRYDKLKGFLAYFQPATNTYAPVERLASLYQAVLDQPDILGLTIGTRPDCIPAEVLELLKQIASQYVLELELGMQTMHDRSLQWMNRGHDHACTVDGVERAQAAGLDVTLHIMLGLPGESYDDMMATARETARLRPHAVKIHNLYVVQRTKLAEDFQRGDVTLIDREDYIRAVVDFIEQLPPQTIIERVSGEAPPQYLIAPSWCAEKPKLREAIEAEFVRRDSIQGCRYEGASASRSFQSNDTARSRPQPELTNMHTPEDSIH
jgi:uncharacterized protein